MSKKLPRPKPNAAAPAPTPQPAAPPAESRFARHPAAFVLASAALLIPCFWQSRLQAGDLSSHIYNAWLAQLIEHGQAPGLRIAFLTTNVLFDLLLKALFEAFGAGAAQRISAAIAVLIFAWGAFAFVSRVAGRPAWHLLPWIAVLSYGWVFHMGFFNFYLSLGLCFWALALAWSLDVRRLAAAAALLAVAWLTHALPVAWTAAVLAYLWLARRLGPKWYLRLLGGACAAIVMLRVALDTALRTEWSWDQIEHVIGFDQAWVFNQKYLLVTALALGMCALWFFRIFREFRSPAFQVCVLTAAGILILPGGALIPGYKNMLVYIADRMSLALAVFLLAALAPTMTRSWDRYVGLLAAALFFMMMYSDESRLNRFEDRVAAVVAQVPAGQRVIGGMEVPGLRVNPLAHMIDRACIGRCYSYANYEPSTAQFRVRVDRENPIVASVYHDAFGLQSGGYVIQDRDLPLYQLLVEETTGNIQFRIPQAGQPCGATAWTGF